MTKIRTMSVLVALTVLMAAAPAFIQNAEATVIPNVTSDLVAFDQTVSFYYDIVDGERTYEYNTYATGCNDRLTVTGIYDTNSDRQSLAWVFPSYINYMCGISELSQYTDFRLVGVDYSIQSDGNTTIQRSTTSSSGSDIHSNAISNSGAVYVTITASYEMAL